MDYNNNVLKAIVILLFIFCSSSVFSEDGQAFIVIMRDKKVKVISPEKKIKSLSLIVKNNTLLTIRGKIVYENNLTDQFLNIESLKSKSIKLKEVDNGKIFFIPLSPPFQKIELKFGNKTYEIPPR